ncbi:uncharacterized protein [Dermacentor albipictus]|uniref:uncharacterized protein n=2 Tax=Dermacentor albipictus TaxID=60249 RepID=UPI0038FC30F0
MDDEMSMMSSGVDVSLMEGSSSEQPKEASSNTLWLLLVGMCVVLMILLLITAFVLTNNDTDLSDKGADGGSDDASEEQRRPGGVYKPHANQVPTQTSGMTPPGVVPLGSTFVPQTAAAAPPTPAVGAPPTPVVVTTLKPVLATTPKPTAAAPPTPAVVIPPTPARKPPTPMRVPSTTTAVPTSPTSGQTTTAGPTTQKPLPDGSLLCTLRAGFKRSTYTFPLDGLCTLITFDSVYKSGYTLVPPYKEDFQYFLDTSKQAKKSEFGIGIEQETCSHEATMTNLTSNVTTKMHLDELWDHYRIYHYGQVGGTITFRNFVASVAVRLAAKGLQMIARIMNDKKDAKLRPSYTILHNWLINPGNVEYVGKALKNVPVDIFVLVVHHHEPDITFNTCRMVPPTVLTSDVLDDLTQDKFYGIRMGSSITLLAANYSHWPPNIMNAVAVGMAGRWYAPCEKGSTSSTGPTGYSLGSKCGGACLQKKLLREHQITDISRACSRTAYNNSFYEDRAFQARVAYDVGAELVFTYDSPINLRTKLCKAKANATNVKYTLAAADIQLEDANGTCGYGPFPRLYMLKKLAEFFAFNYTSAGREGACRAVTY